MASNNKIEDFCVNGERIQLEEEVMIDDLRHKIIMAVGIPPYLLTPPETISESMLEFLEERNKKEKELIYNLEQDLQQLGTKGLSQEKSGIDFASGYSTNVYGTLDSVGNVFCNDSPETYHTKLPSATGKGIPHEGYTEVNGIHFPKVYGTPYYGAVYSKCKFIPNDRNGLDKIKISTESKEMFAIVDHPETYHTKLPPATGIGYHHEEYTETEIPSDLPGSTIELPPICTEIVDTLSMIVTKYGYNFSGNERKEIIRQRDTLQELLVSKGENDE